MLPPKTWSAPGPARWGTPSSCRARTIATPSISTVTAAATSSRPRPTRWPRPLTICAPPAGTAANRGASRCAYRLAFDYALSAPGNAKSAEFWLARGVSRTDVAPWPAREIALQLLLPAGARGPAFLVSRNFNAILRYNNATAYALAVGHLADRLSGGAPLGASWPADERALARAEREELQRRLAARGLDTGGVDGILGNLTRAAVRSYQKKPQPARRRLSEPRCARTVASRGRRVNVTVVCLCQRPGTKEREPCSR